jgi:UDP-N-acetylmuramate dehydrogenase
MGMTYRHTTTPDDYIFTKAIFQGRVGVVDDIKAHIADIKAKRTASQPIREKTGGSTFANPKPEELAAAGQLEGTKTWQLIDRAGCRGLKIGGAMMSEMHANFMINTGTATATDLETLGEEVRRRVLDSSGVSLRWEIKRIGETLP